MLCNPNSSYPNKIDPMIFFQDVCLDKQDIMEQYDNLISQGKYTEANNYISQQEGIYLFSADFFNLIENRIFSTQNYLLTKQPKHPFVFTEEKPENSTLNMLWI